MVILYSFFSFLCFCMFSLHLTTFCLQYKPTVIACVCIHLACKWSNWEIPVSTDGKHWWEYVDQTVTLELLDDTEPRPFPIPPDWLIDFDSRGEEGRGLAKCDGSPYVTKQRHLFSLFTLSLYFNPIMSPTALFLAAKVEEQPRKLEHVIKVSHACLNPLDPLLDTKSDAYLQQAQELVILETMLLQTLGFEITIEHPHTDVVKCTQLVRELTHEFLQILEKTPSRLKKIRNWRATQAARKPKADGQLDNSLLNSSLVPNSILVDPVVGITSSATFPKPSTSAFPAPVALNSGSMPLQATHNADELSILAMPGTSFTISSHHEWPQHQEQPRNDQAYSQKQDGSLSAAQYNMAQLHPGLHHRSEKSSEHTVKQEHSHKTSSSKHHGQIYAPPVTMSHKMSLDKYREKRKLETVEIDVCDQIPAGHLDQPQQSHKKHGQIPGGSSVTSPIKMKIPFSTTEKTDKHSSDKKDKSGSLKLRIPIPPTERGSSKEDLKMKIKVSSADRHSSSDEGSGKSKHSSPHVSKEHKDKHKEHSSNRHHSSSHKHSHSHYSSGSSNNSNKLCIDGMPTTVLRSPVGVPKDGGTSSSSSSRKRPHSNDASYNHHTKMGKSSKSSGSSTSSSSVKQYISSHNTVLNHPLLPPPPVTYQVGYGHLSTLVKLEKKPVESNGPDASHEYGANSQHMDYKDTFDMLDSLLSAQGMNM
ncbi:hypothetical protein AB205_0166100 [Aquarana catesbeiana]|uniref:Uncharacterized protein n=1 Tax=Aquarana catesbeiana TaxID=8400 RepID=A0A2G9RND3_AQUCT|nr:hypothetical protein AB205_0166100 [Aquarana catesbeiana]